MAAYKNLVTITDILLEHPKIDVNQYQSRQMTALAAASLLGNETLMNKLLTFEQLKMVDVDANHSPLIAAIDSKNEKGAFKLIQRFPKSVNQPTQKGDYPLIFAAQTGLETIILELLANGADVKACLEFSKQTPLTTALANKHEKAAAVLIEKCPMLVNQPNKNGFYPLHFAAAYGLVDFIPLLIEKTNLETCIKNGETPLFCALQYNQPEAASLLVYAEWVNLSDNNGITPLHFAAQNGYETLIKALIAKGATAKASSQDEKTPLLLAVCSGHEKVTSLLIEAFPEWINQPFEGLSPFVRAVLQGMVNTVVQMIETDTTFDCLGYENVLLFALEFKESIEKKNKDFFPLLIQKRPQLVNQGDEGKGRALCYAAHNGDSTSVDLLLASGADGIYSLNHAILREDEKAISHLLEKIPDWMMRPDNNGFYVLNCAAQKGFDSFKKFIDKGALVEVCINSSGEPLLNLAVQKNHLEMASYLIEFYPNLVNQANGKGFYPLHFAAQNGLLDMLLLLLNQKAKLDAASKDGKNKYTALYLAAIKGHVEVVKELLTRGADYNYTTKELKSSLVKPLDAAIIKGRIEVIELLLNYPHSTIDLKICLNRATSKWIGSKKPNKQEFYRCSELLKAKLDEHLDNEEPNQEESNEQSWGWCFVCLYSTPPIMQDFFFPVNKEYAIRYALTSCLELLLNPNACVPYLLDLSKTLEQAWAKEYPDEPWVKFNNDSITLWTHQGFNYPIPNHKFQKGMKKHCLLERWLVTEFQKHGMAEFQYKWTGYVDKELSIELLSNNPIFKENGRTINGLFHGNVHNLQRLILLEAMKKGVIPIKYKENGEKKTLEIKEVFSALMRRDIGIKKPHAPLWQKVLDSAPSQKRDSFTLPHTLHSMILTHKKLAGFLQDYMRYSFCNKLRQAHELFNTLCDKEHSTDAFLNELKKLELLTFANSQEKAIKIEKNKAQDTNAEFKSDQKEKLWSVVSKQYKPLLFVGVEEVDNENQSSALGCSI